MKNFWQEHGSEIAEFAFGILFLGSFVISAIVMQMSPVLPVVASQEKNQPALSSLARLPSNTSRAHDDKNEAPAKPANPAAK
jgi:hypothetical protein